MSHLNIKIDDQLIDKVEKTKFLGVVIDSKLSWKNHISLVSGKLSKSIGMIIKAREYLNRNALLTLYYSFVYPYLTYCNPVWGCTYYSNLKQLFILQKKALRIMCGKSRRESTENIFSDLKILKFTDINTYLTGRFMYKFYKKNVPEIFTSFFQCNSSVHGYSTRQREYLHAPPVKSNLSQFSIRYRGVVVWNAILKSKINPDVSEFVFVKSFKAHILDKKFAVS